MSSLNSILDEFREFKNNPPRKPGLTAGLQGLRRKILVPIPMMKDYRKRFLFMVFCLQLGWSGTASAALLTGAFISLLSIFADNPGGMIRALFNDPDVEVQLAEVADISETGIKLATRGKSMDAQEQEMWRAAQTGPYAGYSSNPFAVRDWRRIIPASSEELQIAIQTVTAQIWILLTKAVTAIATAADSENRRWQKYEQQRRANADYRLAEGWRNNARNKIASDLCIRRFMVEILIDANKAPHPKARILELICDIGNYISEAGMAGFFLTIKYGIETKYPALALNEFQADLATVLSLMKAYTQMGERAPFMVILENSEQTKFSPGSYPLLWSYAMGVGATLDRAVNNLNYTKGFMEQQFYDLGASMVAKMEGSVSRKMAEELGLTDDQIDQVKTMVQQDSTKGGKSTRNPNKMRSDAGSFKPNSAEDVINEEDEEDEDDDDDQGASGGYGGGPGPSGDQNSWYPEWKKKYYDEGQDQADKSQKLRDEVGDLLKNLGKKNANKNQNPKLSEQNAVDDMSVIKNN
ncbi:nucleocapsid protein [Denotus virus]|nr:nucleocapsid protein [Denotus virus]